MFSRDTDKIQKAQSSSSVIGVEMQINGNIKCSGNLVLKGKVRGKFENERLNKEYELIQYCSMYLLNCLFSHP